jgi:Flp pilus assembly protein CpaB
MTASTMLVLAAVVTLFAGFAAALAWAQPHARQLTAAPADASRPRRRPF